MPEEFIKKDRNYDVQDEAKVPFQSYLELENEKKRIEEEYETFKEDIFGYISSNDLAGAMEYCTSKGMVSC